MRHRALVLMGAALLVASHATAQKQPGTALGAPVAATTMEGRKVRGELIAVREDSVWILSRGGLVALHVPDLAGVKVRRHRLGDGRVLVGGLIAGAVSVLALVAACQSVEDSECASLPVGILFAWATFTGMGAAGADAAANLHLQRSDLSRLNRYARFPQGPPAQLRELLLPAAPADSVNSSQVTGPGTTGG